MDENASICLVLQRKFITAFLFYITITVAIFAVKRHYNNCFHDWFFPPLTPLYRKKLGHYLTRQCFVTYQPIFFFLTFLSLFSVLWEGTHSSFCLNSCYFRFSSVETKKFRVPRHRLFFTLCRAFFRRTTIL